ncbi:hypothetical protein [Streptomyces sp. DSM 41534]
MTININPRREAAIKASQRAETALDNAEEAYKTAKDNGDYAARVTAWDQLRSASRTAAAAREVTEDEYQRARIANGHGPDPLVPYRI